MPAIDHCLVEQPGIKPASNFTEILLHNSSISLQPVLLPMIAQLSRQDRWLTLINPPISLDRKLLAQGGANLTQILVLRANTHDQELRLFKRALASGTSHTVVGWNDNRCQHIDINALDQDARRGDCLGILVRS